MSAFRAFKKALVRATEQDLKSHHRTELAELEMEKANIWRAMDEPDGHRGALEKLSSKRLDTSLFGGETIRYSEGVGLKGLSSQLRGSGRPTATKEVSYGALRT